MTTRILALGLLAAVGSAMTVRLAPGHGWESEIPLDPAGRSEMLNRDIERRLDLVVNGPSTECTTIRNPPVAFHPPGATRFITHPAPCPSPEPWRTNP